MRPFTILPAALLLIVASLRGLGACPRRSHPRFNGSAQRRACFHNGLWGLGVLLLADPGFAACASGGPANAGCFNAQTFRPAAGPGNVFSLEGTLMPRRLLPLAGVTFEYAHRPVRLLDSEGQVFATPVPFMLTAHAMAGLAVTRWLALYAVLPVVVYQGFDRNTPVVVVPLDPGAAGVGDLRISAKLRFLDNQQGGLGVAGSVQLYAPTGAALSDGSFRSDNTFAVEPRLILDYRLRHGLFFTVNASFYARTYNQSLDFGLVRLGHQLRYGIGAVVPILAGLGVAGELAGSIGISALQGGPRYTPLEGYLGVRFTHGSGLYVETGGGSGLLAAVGSPQGRAFLAIGFLPSPKKAPPRPTPAEGSAPVRMGLDQDGDGVLGAEDSCPRQAGPKENRGCPERDLDSDGVVDRLDKCPEEPGPARRNGCPEVVLDTDGDGVEDEVDRCPEQAGVVDNDGCPDTDGDQDGVVDRLDRCPARAGSQEAGGCPIIEVKERAIALMEPLKFAPGKVPPEPSSARVVQAVASVLLGDAGIKKATLIVSASGARKAARRLAAQRARSLTAMFSLAGVSRRQLLIKGAKAPGSDEVNAIMLYRGRTDGVDRAGGEKKAKKRKRVSFPRFSGQLVKQLLPCLSSRNMAYVRHPGLVRP